MGQSLGALLKSYSEKIPIALTSFAAPYRYEKLECPVSIEGQTLYSFYDTWNFVRFISSLEGLVINPRPVETVRLSSNKLMFDRLEVDFDVCHLFGNKQVSTDLDTLEVKNKGQYRVLDIMKLVHCNVKNVDNIKTRQCFIERMDCYGAKEIVCTSYLTIDQLNSFDYSDTMSRFIVEKALLEDERVIRPRISPTRGLRKPKPKVVERVVEPWEENILKEREGVTFYGRDDSLDIVKAFSRNHTGIRV